MAENNTKTKYMSLPLIRHKKYKQLKNKANYMRSNNFYKEAIIMYLNSMLINRNCSDTYLGLGICYKNLGKLQKAIKFLEKSALLDKNNFETFYELGICHLEDQMACKAIKCFIHAIELEPDNPDAIYQLGIAHEKCDEEDMAILIYQKLIENSPLFIKAYIRKSDLLIKMGLYNQALEINKQILKISSQCTKTYFDIAYCFDKIGKQREAKRYYHKFLETGNDIEQVNYAQKRISELKRPSALKSILHAI